METTEYQPSLEIRPLAIAWLGLVLLTLLSLVLGSEFHGAKWLQVLVAGIVWLKGWLVASQFIEAKITRPFIRRVLLGFIAFAPAALLFTAFFGHEFARWATL